MTSKQVADPELKQTPLYGLHLELGATTGPFAGYSMPLHYPAGVLKEHQHTRAQAGLFDVSHMGQVRLSGVNVAEELERLVPGDILGLSRDQQRYTLLLNEHGGIIDDLMVTNAGDHLFAVLNAACKENDLTHLRTSLSETCTVDELKDQALLALQGPAAAVVMERLAPAATKLVFMTAGRVELAGVECLVTRCGYTGEDGFEISLPGEEAERVARRLLDQPEVEAIGLGARDSLRLEAGLCLYGQDIDETVTPIEASLNWAIPKVRRRGGERADGYPGAEVINRQLVEGVARRRVGILPEGRAPVRAGVELQDLGGRAVGVITSGGFGPSLGRPVAMGYVETAHSELENQLMAIVRGRPQPVRVARTPFVPQGYYRG